MKLTSFNLLGASYNKRISLQLVERINVKNKNEVGDFVQI